MKKFITNLLATIIIVVGVGLQTPVNTRASTPVLETVTNITNIFIPRSPDGKNHCQASLGAECTCEGACWAGDLQCGCAPVPCKE